MQLYFGTLPLALCCHCRDSITHGFLSKYFFKESNNMAIKKNLFAIIKFYKKECLPVIACNKKHSPKLYQHTGENAFAAATFEGFEQRGTFW